MTEVVAIRGEGGDVFLRSTAPGVVIAGWAPRGLSNPVWRGSIVVVSEDASFPDAACETRDVSALRVWIENAYPNWLRRPTRASVIDPHMDKPQTSEYPDRLLALQELRALGVLDESEYAAEAERRHSLHRRRSVGSD
jgi:hypothetical protein